MTQRMKIFCNNCKCDTHHEMKCQHERHYYESNDHADGTIEITWYEQYLYSFWICLGCDTATLAERFHCTPMYDENGEVFETNYFPPRTNYSTRKPKGFLHIDKKLMTAYHEIITAYTNRLYIICSMGIRALLEGICIHEGITDKQARSLNEKITMLQDNNRVPSGIIDGLKHLKPIGDDAAHRLDAASNHHIGLAIDLLEALLTHLYEARFDLEAKAKRIQHANHANV